MRTLEELVDSGAISLSREKLNRFRQFQIDSCKYLAFPGFLECVSRLHRVMLNISYLEDTWADDHVNRLELREDFGQMNLQDPLYALHVEQKLGSEDETQSREVVRTLLELRQMNKQDYKRHLGRAKAALRFSKLKRVTITTFTQNNY